MKQFKIRCSAISEIMTEPKSTKDEKKQYEGKQSPLSKTAQSYCQRWIKEQIYQRRYEINNKYLDKGIKCEEQGIDALIMAGIIKPSDKNQGFFLNEWCTGTPDIITHDNIIVDIKSSWDCFTFPLFDSVLDKTYYWQMQGYMWLTNTNSAKVAYVLTDTPDELIIREANNYCYKNGIEKDDADVYEQFRERMTYGTIADEYKIRVFDCERDDKAIDAIQARVIQCRLYIDMLLNTKKL